MRVLGHVPSLGSLGAAAVLCAVTSGCGGGGGGGGARFDGQELSDPIIQLEGESGRYSRTPEEANAAADDALTDPNGYQPPPRLFNNPVGRNHYFRLEFPFRITPETFLVNDPLLAPFSFLNGNITVTDENGNHVPGIGLVNGVDVFGNDRSQDPGFPGGFRNLRHVDDDGVEKDVFLYVADVDEDLSTFAAFNPAGPPESNLSSLNVVQIALNEANTFKIDGRWQIVVSDGAPERILPEVLSIEAEAPDPTDPSNALAAATNSTFLVRFSEPVIPQSVGESAELNGFPFTGNKPVPPINIPVPNTIITASINTGNSTLYIPFDCVPINSNNLSVYRLRPLTLLPAEQSLSLQVSSITNNTGPGGADAVRDLSGNFFDGVNADTTNAVANFSIGPGPALINVPVSPEVVYWLPSQGRGIGAIDLNGWGFTTNTPGRFKDDPSRPAIVVTSQTLNTATGIATRGFPCDPPPGFCTHNQYSWQAGIGLGGYAYGNGISPIWDDPTDPGNPGTPIAGVNELSSGLDEFVRNSDGDPVLTGRDFSDIGVLEDMVLGEFLDMIYFDTQNFNVNDSFHFSTYGQVFTQGRNVISDPPAPNPPPLRYWVGLPQIDIVLDVFDPNLSAFLIEGDEVWTGTRSGVMLGISYQQLQPNVNNPFGPDQTIFPHTGVGPGVQSSTQGFQYSARQQIGNFLYVTDAENKSVHALNSNTMRIIASVRLPDPRGLGVASNNELLYVSNSEDDSLSVVDINPLSPTFHTEIARVGVGAGPRAVTVQPDNEDVFTCNLVANSLSIVDQQTLTVRKEITALIDQPFDICLTGRQGTPTSQAIYGFAAGIYFGYVSNFGGNNLLVFESGPDGPQGIGSDNILGELPTGDSDRDFIIQPRGLCYAPFANQQGFDAGGVFLAHQDEEGFGRVSLIQFSNQAQFGPLPTTSPPGFFLPPGFLNRNFDLVASWGNTDDNRLAGFQPSDVVLADLDVATYQDNPSGAPNFSTGFPPPNVDETGFINSHHFMRCAQGQCFHAWQPDRLYVSFADSDDVQVLDPQQAGIVLKTIDSGTGFGIKKLSSYWKQ